MGGLVHHRATRILAVLLLIGTITLSVVLELNNNSVLKLNCRTFASDIEIIHKNMDTMSIQKTYIMIKNTMVGAPHIPYFYLLDILSTPQSPYKRAYKACVNNTVK